MSMLPGLINAQDNMHGFIRNVGQGLVTDAVAELLAVYNEEINLSMGAFVEKQTEQFKVRYLLPGGGRLQVMGRQAPAAAFKRYGYYDVAFPLRQYGVEISGGRVDLAYTTVAEMDAHIDAILTADMNTMRERLLVSIFENDNLAYTDEYHGAITVTRLANGDGTLFPPVLGSEDEADDDHYLNAGYNVAGIAAGQNPAVTLRNEISEHFGGVGTRGRNFVYFHGADQTAYLAAIAGYNALSDQYITAGNDTAVVNGLPNVPGRIHGRGWGCWLSEWDGWIPDTYGLMVLLDVAAPLIMRVDPKETGLNSGLQMVARDINHPLERMSFERRFGFGCGNRLSAAIMLVTDGGTYLVPGAYAE